MRLTTLTDYPYETKDRRKNFPAPLLYIGWDDHMMFCAPVCLSLPADTPFGALQAEILGGVYGAHPDFAKIDWSGVTWLKSGQPFAPDNALSLADNGLGHKDVIRFKTPGLNGLQGSHG